MLHLKDYTKYVTRCIDCGTEVLIWIDHLAPICPVCEWKIETRKVKTMKYSAYFENEALLIGRILCVIGFLVLLSAYPFPFKMFPVFMIVGFSIIGVGYCGTWIYPFYLDQRKLGKNCPHCKGTGRIKNGDG